MSNYQSIVFNSNGQVVDTDLESHVRPNNVVPDSQKANIHIQTRDGNLRTFNSGSGVETVAPKVTSVQLKQPDGRIAILGTTVAPDVYEKMKETSPHLFDTPEVTAEKAAEAKAEADNAKDQEALRESLARHSDDQAEAAHMMFVGEVPQREAIALLVQMHRDGVPSDSTLHKVGEAMGLSPDQAVTTLNKMAGGVQNQLTALAGAHGVDPVAFSDWMRSSRREESLKAMTTHVLSRDVFGAWNSHLVDFKARGGKR